MDLSPSFKAEFIANIHLTYQEKGGKLREAVYSETGVTGSKVEFPYMGSIETTDATGAGIDVTGSDVTNGNIECLLAPKDVNVYTGKFDLARSAGEGRNARLAEGVGMALGRQEDQFIIDAMSAAVTAGTVTNVIAAGATGSDGFTMDKFRKAKRLLDTAGVPSEGRHIAITPAAADDLLANTEFGSIDYNNVKALVDGDVNGMKFLGFTIHQLADSPNATASKVRGLPGVGTSARKLYAWHRDALGYGASDIDKSTAIDWIPQKKSYLIAGDILAGACVVDPSGVVEINVVES